jgi:hypothetical protein
VIVGGNQLEWSSQARARIEADKRGVLQGANFMISDRRFHQRRTGLCADGPELSEGEQGMPQVVEHAEEETSSGRRGRSLLKPVPSGGRAALRPPVDRSPAWHVRLFGEQPQL